jgi:hypothetical protein
MPLGEFHVGQRQHTNASDNDGRKHHLEDGEVLEAKLIHDHVVVGDFAPL